MISETLIHPWIREGYLQSERLAGYYRALNASAKDIAVAVQPDRWSVQDLSDDAKRRHDEAYDALDMLELEADKRTMDTIEIFKSIVRSYGQYRRCQSAEQSPAYQNDKSEVLNKAYEARVQITLDQQRLLK